MLVAPGCHYHFDLITIWQGAERNLQTLPLITVLINDEFVSKEVKIIT
jgi:hypothetical protein